MTPMPKERFASLVNYVTPRVHAAMYEEIEWYSTIGERFLGAVILDKADRDYSWVLLSRDAASVYRAIDLGTSSSSPLEARQALTDAMGKASR